MSEVPDFTGQEPGPRPNPQLVHLLEQHAANIRAHAPLIYGYYRAMVDAGFSEEHAFRLTERFHDYWVARITREDPGSPDYPNERPDI